jgi:hypothetical protein
MSTVPDRGDGGEGGDGVLADRDTPLLGRVLFSRMRATLAAVESLAALASAASMFPARASGRTD